MKKKLLWMMLFCLMFTGCQKSGNPDPTEITAGNDRESESPTSASTETSEPTDPTETPESPQDADQSLPDYACSGTYYKLEIKPAVYDVDAIMKYLMPGIDRSRAQRDERGAYSIEIDNITHVWGSYTGEIGFNNFDYHKNIPDLSRIPTEQEARTYSDDLIQYLNYQVAENPELIQRENGPSSVCYYFEYEGVPILGNSNYTMGNGEIARGEYILVSMDGGGICHVNLSGLYDVTAVLEEYPAEELISSSQLDDIINFAINAIFQQFGDPRHEYGFRVKEINLIYIPAQEKEKWMLLPAFCVRYVKLVDGEVEQMDMDGEVVTIESKMLIDAVSGYVYSTSIP